MAAVRRMKKRKAVGIDAIPMKALVVRWKSGDEKWAS